MKFCNCAMVQFATIAVSAPTRIADLGGWTDTWFAGSGAVCSLAVWPGVNVTIAPADGPAGVELRVTNYDREWHWTPGTPPQVCPDPLLGACLDEGEVPDGAWALEIGSPIPPGASMGTSASACVAVLAALDCLRGRPLDPSSLARRAHDIETRRLAQQSGIQDQWAAAAGGISLLEMEAYPVGRRTALPVAPATIAALQDRLIVVWLGHAHHSSAVHDQVVQALADAGPDDERLIALRACARAGADALVSGDLRAYGATLTRNTQIQARLHPSLVGSSAQALIEAVRGDDVTGWKVNGAGGAGGSLTVLAADREARAGVLSRITTACRDARVLDVQLAQSGVQLT